MKAPPASPATNPPALDASPIATSIPRASASGRSAACNVPEARCGVTCLGDLVECRCGQQKARGHENRQQRDTVEHLQKRWQTPEAR